MRRFPVARKSWRDYRTAFISSGVVLLLMGLITVAIYPSYRESLEGMELPAGFEGFLGEAESLTSPEGFIGAEFFSWIPLLLIVVAVIAGTGVIAGEESAGTLDLLLAQPISRRRLLLERFGGVALGLLIATLLALPGFALGLVLVDFDLSFGRFFAATLNMLPVTLLFLAFALWMSTALPNRTAASTLTIGLVVFAYVLNLLGSSVELLDGPRRLSPFYWSEATRVLIHGFDFLRAGGLLGVTAIFLLLALRSFEQRDIASGGRDWSLLRSIVRLARREEAATPARDSRGAQAARGSER